VHVLKSVARKRLVETNGLRTLVCESAEISDSAVLLVALIHPIRTPFNSHDPKS
jgi:hypothetical protein